MATGTDYILLYKILQDRLKKIEKIAYDSCISDMYDEGYIDSKKEEVKFLKDIGVDLENE
jgi:hypothetical protein